MAKGKTDPTAGEFVRNDSGRDVPKNGPTTNLNSDDSDNPVSGDRIGKSGLRTGSERRVRSLTRNSLDPVTENLGTTTEPLSEVARIVKGTQLNRLDINEGVYPVWNGGNKPSGFHNKWNTEGGVITISGGGSCGFVNLATQRFWQGGDCYALQDLSPKIDRDFLYYSLKSREPEIMRLGVGSGLPHIYPADLERLPVVIPPLGEQREIAHILSSMQNEIQSLEAHLSKVRVVYIAAMHDFLTVRRRIPRSDEFWPMRQLGELFEISSGKTMSAAAREGKEKTPFLRTSNVLWDEIDLTQVDEMVIPSHELPAKYLKPGDLLVCEGGEIGRAAIWNGERPVMSFQNHLHRLRPLKDNVEPRFYVYFLQCGFTQLRLFEGAGNKTTIQTLSRNRLAALNVPHPAIEEQKHIVEVLSTIHNEIESLEDRLSKVRVVQLAAMQDLLAALPASASGVFGD